MNLLITGACGHIGSYLIHNINKIKNIKKIYLIDNLLNEKTNSLFKIKSKKKFFFFLRDLKKKNSLNDINNINIVIHLASITNAAASFNIKKEIFENNLGCFKNVVNFCIKNRAKLIHISSASVYGKTSGIVTEDSGKKDINPQSPYAKIKFLEEQILKKKTKKIKFNTFRFGTIVGVSKGMRFHTAVNSFCLRATIGDYINIYKMAKNQYRPYLSIKDSFKVFKFCIEKNFFTNDIFNALSGNFTVNQIIKKIKKFKRKLKIKYVTSPIMNQLSYHVDNKKLSNSGLILNSNLNSDIRNTIKLLNYLQ
jgi:nucleoside-diphosphate-sugar epimerase